MAVSRRTVLATLGAGILLPIRTAQAQSFPNRPIRIIVPFPAGGPTDILSRVIAQKMSEDWGQPVVVENRPGADTAIGAVQVAKAPPDGYTLLAAMDTTLVMNPATKTNLPYDPFKDFAAVTLAAKNTSLLTVRAQDGPKTIPELIARAKASGKMNYGAGIITTRLAGYMFNRAAGISCRVRNMSPAGACLEVTSQVGIPDEFVLVVDYDKFKHQCHVIWRSDARMGVEFRAA